MFVAGQHPAVIGGSSLGGSDLLLPPEVLPGEMDLDPEAGQGRDEEQKADRPVEGEEQSHYDNKRHPILPKQIQAVDDGGWAVGPLPLGPVQGVPVVRIFVVGQIEIDRFFMHHLMHIVGDGDCLGLVRIGGKAGYPNLDDGDTSGNDDQENHM